MFKFRHILFAILLTFSVRSEVCAQQHIHDINWYSDTVGMWGSGSTAWTIDRIDTLVDFSIGPYGDSYGYVYNLPWPLDDSIGAIFNYGLFLDMQLIFEMTGWSGGSVYVNYPTKIQMDMPPNGSFINGDWATIQSEYREQDTLVHPADLDKWEINAKFPEAGKIWLYLNMTLQANMDLIYSNPLDPFNITWDTLNIFPPVNIDLDTFDIILIDLPNGDYVIPWVAYHTDPFTGNTVIDSIYFLHDSVGWPLQFPAIFYDLIGISGDISIPQIDNYVTWIENEQRLYTWGQDEYLHINLDIVKFVQMMCHYLSNIPSLAGLEAVSQMIEYEEGDTSIYLFTDPFSGEDFTVELAWDLLDLELLFTSSMNSTLSFCDNKEYTFFGFPIPPNHYPNVWDIVEFPIALDYRVLDTLGTVIETGTSDSIKFGADYDVQVRYPCTDMDSIPVRFTHTIDPWLTHMLRDSVDVALYVKVLDFDISIGTPSNPLFQTSFVLYEDTIQLGSFAGPPWFGPPIWMPWLMAGHFGDSTCLPDDYLVPMNNPVSDTILVEDIFCFGTSTGGAQVVVNGGLPPFTYQWSDGTTIISTTDSIFNVPLGTYYVTITDAAGCILIDSVTLTNLNPPIIVSHTSTDVLCHGDSTGAAQITASGGSPGFTYQWSPGVSTSNQASNLAAGTYLITVTDAVGCHEYDTIVITEPDSAILIVVDSVINNICNGYQQGAVNISVYGGTPPFSYNWSNGSTSQDLTNVLSGIYYLTVTDFNLCQKIDSIEILQPDPIICWIHDESICNGMTATIVIDSTSGGTPPYQYLWSTGATGTSITVNPFITSTYSVVASDANNCSGAGNVATVNVTPPLFLNLYIKKDTFCIGETVVIYADVIGGGGPPYTVLLSNGMSGEGPFYITPQQSGTIYGTVWDTCGFASYTDSVHYTIVPLPDINIAASTVAGCEPLSVQFFETTPQPGDTYLWYFGDQTYSNLQNPQHTFFEHGQYDVALCVTNMFGCSDTVFAENYITVYPNPFAAFTYSPPQLDEINSTVNFINGSLNIAESHWSFGDGETSLQYNPTHTYTTAGTYDVQLLVITEYGCRDSTMLTIDIRNIYTLYIPNAFTPNENGLNEYFIPKGDNFNPDEYVFMIYDRWGGKVFETTNVGLGWDGSINGEPCKSGVYAYVIHFREKTGLEQKYIGHVTLIR